MKPTSLVVETLIENYADGVFGVRTEELRQIKSELGYVQVYRERIASGNLVDLETVEKWHRHLARCEGNAHTPMTLKQFAVKGGAE